MQLSNIEIFLAVIRAGGFAPVARERGVAPSSISRAVHNLEEELGVRLLNRSTRIMALTEAGEIFLQKVSPAVEELNAAKDAVLKTRLQPSGHLRVSASVAFGNVVIAPLLKTFRAKYPEITIELLLSDSVVDIVGEGIDLAIRHGELADSALVCKRLCDVEYYLVASPEYLRSAANIDYPSDLNHHSLINYTLSNFKRHWWFVRDSTTESVSVNAAILSSNPTAIRVCARDGLGIAPMADWLVAEDLRRGLLVQLLPQWQVVANTQDQKSSIWLVRHSREFLPAKVSLFEDYLLSSVNHSRD